MAGGIWIRMMNDNLDDRIINKDIVNCKRRIIDAKNIFDDSLRLGFIDNYNLRGKR